MVCLHATQTAPSTGCLNGCAVDMALSLCRRGWPHDIKRASDRIKRNMTLPMVSASAFRRRSDGFVDRRCQHLHSRCSFGVGALGLSTRNSARQFQSTKKRRGQGRLTGGEGYFPLAMEWWHWRGLRSFPTRFPWGQPSAQLRRPRPWSAMSASRRLHAAGCANSGYSLSAR